MTGRITMTAIALAALICTACPAETDPDGWTAIFDGETLDGWKKAVENQDAWKVEDGALTCAGSRCHLFYVGQDEPFVNFEFMAEVMTAPKSNSGIYIHTKYQETGWPHAGYEVQVNNTHGDPKKTGGLYDVVNVLKAPAEDNKWFTQHIIVDGKRIVVKIDGETVVDYTEPPNKKPGNPFTRVLDRGTFALQAHDPGSVVRYRNIRVKRLP